MKIHAVKDHTGKVIATYEKASGGRSVAPVLADGHTAHEIEVAEDYKDHIKAVYEKHSN